MSKNTFKKKTILCCCLDRQHPAQSTAKTPGTPPECLQRCIARRCQSMPSGPSLWPDPASTLRRWGRRRSLHARGEGALSGATLAAQRCSPLSCSASNSGLK